MFAAIIFVIVVGYIEIADPEWIYTHREAMIDEVKSKGSEKKWTQEKMDSEIKAINDSYIFH
jgi:hypothetical protein